ncbi:MAG: protein-export chaperone SecB, partial [Lactobacillus sp.]|nr:protein-export chaperone SecB [Lactobacillus sp.]
IKLDVTTNTQHLEENIYNVALTFELNSEINDKKFFIMELTYAAVVSLNVPKEHIEPMLVVEVPRILFPFARSIVTNSLVDAGLPPFMINPIDFAALYQAKNSVKN